MTGIEARGHHVAQAEGLFHELGVEKSRYAFHAGDIFDRVDLFDQTYDLVLGLGFLYHTARHTQLLSRIRGTGAGCLIIDTAISTLPGAVLELLTEDTGRPGNGSGSTDAADDRALVAHPSRPALDLMLSHFGYRARAFDWPALLHETKLAHADVPKGLSADNPMADYIRGERVTVCAML